MYGNGYVKGAFDMTNRYNAGDWRQYYFDVKDPSINTASISISWKDQDSNFSVFMIDPQGRIIQTNVPSGVFGQLMDWPTSDWLGTTPFSEGGGFYPVKNKDNTSTILSSPINQTGTYTLLLHSTLFGGKSTTEPFTVLAKFSSMNADEQPTEMVLPTNHVNDTIDLPINSHDGVNSTKHYTDNKEFVPDDKSKILEGENQLKTESTDNAGTKSFDKASEITQTISIIPNKFDFNFALLIFALVFAIGIALFIILSNKSQKSRKN